MPPFNVRALPAFVLILAIIVGIVVAVPVMGSSLWPRKAISSLSPYQSSKRLDG